MVRDSIINSPFGGGRGMFLCSPSREGLGFIFPLILQINSEKIIENQRDSQ
jgi:hypothetical protein